MIHIVEWLRFIMGCCVGFILCKVLDYCKIKISFEFRVTTLVIGMIINVKKKFICITPLPMCEIYIDWSEKKNG